MSDGKRRILVVDDEPSIVKMVSKRLEVKGFEVPVVIMFSGKGQPEDVERCRQAGAYGYVSKTQGTAALLEQIETVLQRPSA